MHCGCMPQTALPRSLHFQLETSSSSELAVLKGPHHSQRGRVRAGQPPQLCSAAASFPCTQMELDANGDAVKVVPLYSFDFKALNLSTTCAPAAGAFPCTTPEGESRRCGRPCTP